MRIAADDRHKGSCSDQHGCGAATTSGTRGLVEFTGEHTGGVRVPDAVVPDSSTTSLWLGPSVLPIFKNVAIEGGVQGPLFRDGSPSVYGCETIRFVLNFSYLKFSSQTKTH
jgi:hypothetical protein